MRNTIQEVINQLVPVRQLLEKGLVIQADRKLDEIIERLADKIKAAK